MRTLHPCLTVHLRQKRQLFTYYRVKALYDHVHATLKMAATVTRDNVDFFLGAKG